MLEINQIVNAATNLADGSQISSKASVFIVSHALLLLLDQAIDGLAYPALFHHSRHLHHAPSTPCCTMLTYDHASPGVQRIRPRHLNSCSRGDGISACTILAMLPGVC